METKEPVKKLEKIFPKYFELFTLPEGAREESFEVYRACRSGKCDKASFLPTYEEQGFKYLAGDDPKNPSIYSLSTYIKPRDVKRFASMDSDMQIPYKIAIGRTEPEYGLAQPSKEWDPEMRMRKSSHVDWWLYKDATPHEIFTLIPDWESYFEEFKKKRDEKNEKVCDNK